MGRRNDHRVTREHADEALYRGINSGGGGGGSGITQLTDNVLAGPGSGSQAARTVKLNNATVPIAGALTPGDVLTVSGPSALTYAPPPASISSVFDDIQVLNNANLPIAPNATKNILVKIENLSANRTATMPAPGSMNAGQKIGFVDSGGSLGGFFVTVAGNGSNLNGLASFVLGAGTIGTSPGGGIGPRGAIWFEWDGANFFVVS